MIATVADLLEAFRQQESQLLDKQNIHHAPTIGSMYEGLTRNVLEMALPHGLDLRVVSGFITNEKGQLSRQIDCMLVEGEGEQIPYTGDYKYDIEKVIAVVEVKKKLYSDELDSAYKNLMSVSELHELRKPENRLFADAFRHILQSDPAICDIRKLPAWKRQVGLALYQESILPVRVALGYHGFASEFSFREAFMNYLENNLQTSGYGPVNLPDLIISNNYSLIKLNGMPYGVPIMKDRQDREELFAEFYLEYDPDDMPQQDTDLWVLYGSYAVNPMILFLQLVWTRLVYQNKVSPEIFGLDLDIEVIRPLILAKAIEIGGEVGWNYEYFAISEEALNSIPSSLKWCPVEVNRDQAVVLAYLGVQESKGMASVDINDAELLGQLERPEQLAQILKLLQKFNLVYLDNNKLQLLTRQLRIAALPDGRLVAGDDGGSRLSGWIIENYSSSD